jgi:hypothetical protein
VRRQIEDDDLSNVIIPEQLRRRNAMRTGKQAASGRLGAPGPGRYLRPHKV